MIDISVIMPVYNSERYLGEAIESILSQSYEKFELILVNDGSTDSSGIICDEFSAKDNRIKVIHKKNGGISDARNSGLMQAVGEYIAFADNDDLFKYNLLEKNIEYAKKHNADIVKFGVEYIEVDDKYEKEVFIRDLPFKAYTKLDITTDYQKLKNNNIFVYVWDCLIRRDLIVNNQLKFSTDFKYGGEDIDFNYKIFEYVNILIINPEKYYIHFKRFGHSTVCKFSIEKLNPFLLNAKQEKLYLDVMKIKIDENLLVNIISSYVIQISYTLAHIDQMSKESKIQYLRDNSLFEIFNSSYMPLWFLKSFFIQPKRAMIYWLYAHKFYKLLIKLCA